MLGGNRLAQPYHSPILPVLKPYSLQGAAAGDEAGNPELIIIGCARDCSITVSGMTGPGTADLTVIGPAGSGTGSGTRIGTETGIESAARRSCVSSDACANRI